MARPTPVLPDVGSTIVPPCFSNPSRSAASVIATAGRSFTEPPGLLVSILTMRSQVRPRLMRGTRTSGVSPMRPRTESATSISRGSPGTPRRYPPPHEGAFVLDRRGRVATGGVGGLLVPRRRPAEEQDREHRHPASG